MGRGNLAASAVALVSILALLSWCVLVNVKNNTACISRYSSNACSVQAACGHCECIQNGSALMSNVAEQPASVTNFVLVWHRHLHSGLSSSSAVILDVVKFILPAVVLVYLYWLYDGRKRKGVDDDAKLSKKGFKLALRVVDSEMSSYHKHKRDDGADLTTSKAYLKWGKHGGLEDLLIDEFKSGGLKAFNNKPAIDIDHLFEFRRDQCFEQTCTACPATVSLVSHFASGTYGQPGTRIELHKEGVRLASFKDFPTTIPVSALRMAQAGFHYTGEQDVVKCFSCGVTHQGWQMGDRPSLVHARISPNCSLVRGSDKDNLPLPQPVTSRPIFNDVESLNHDSGYGSRSFDSSSGVVSSSGMSNGLSNNSNELQHDSAPDAVTDSMPSSGPQALGGTASLIATVQHQPIPSSLATPENSMFSGAPLFGRATPMDGGAPRNQQLPAKRLDLGGAVYPLYSQMDARKRSYTNWVTDRGAPSVEELITLGFFYAGYADCVRCFFCGIGLKSWEPGDIPAEVHARWRPTCEYLRLVKGDEFVDRVANGGRNVSTTNSGAGTAGSVGNGTSTTGGQAQQSAPNRDSVDNGSSAPTNNTSSAPVQVPDIPIVRRARETGYTDQQIAEAIEKLRIIGMERAIEIMLVEVLTNLYRDNPPQPRNRQNSPPPNQQPNQQPNNNHQVAGDEDSGFDSTMPSQRSDAFETDDGTETDAAPSDAAAAPEVVEHQTNLQQENSRLKEMRTCRRCRDQPVGVIFLPCGHIVSCTGCAPSIRRCLRCDTVIRATANVFFS